MGELDQVGMRAVIQGADKYIADATKMQTATRNFGTSMVKAGTDAQSGGTKVNAITQLISANMAKLAFAVTSAVAAFASYQTIKNSIAYTAQLGEQVDKLATETGAATEDISKMIFIFGHFGIAAGQASSTLSILAKKLRGVQDEETGLTEGGAGAARTFNELGLTATTADGKLRPMLTLFSEIADKFKDMANGQEKVRIATELFGRSGRALIPLLNLGAKGFEELGAKAEKLGLVLSADNVAKIQKYTFATRDWQAALGGLKLQIGVALMPVLTTFFNFLIEQAPAVGNALRSVIKVIVDIADGIIGALMPVGEQLRSFMEGAFVQSFTTVVNYVRGQFLPAANDFARAVSVTMLGAAREAADFFGNELLPPLQKAAGVMKDTLQPAIDGVSSKLGSGMGAQQSTKALAIFGVTLTGVVGTMAGLDLAVNVVGNALGALGASFMVIKDIPNPFILLAVGAAALVAASVLVEEKTHFFSDTFGPTLQGIADFVRMDVVPAFNEWANSKAIPMIQEFGRTIREEVLPAIADLGGNLLAFAQTEIAPRVQEFVAFVQNEFIPAIRDELLPELSDWYDAFKDLTDKTFDFDTAVVTLQGGVRDLVGAMILLEPYLVKMGALMDRHKTEFIIMGGSMLFVAAAFGSVAAGITLLVGAFYAVLSQWPAIRSYFEGVADRIHQMISPFELLISTILKLPVVGTALKAMFVETFKTVVTVVVTALRVILDIFSVFYHAVMMDWPAMWDDLQNIVVDTFNGLVKIVNQGLNLILEGLGGFIGAIADVAGKMPIDPLGIKGALRDAEKALIEGVDLGQLDRAGRDRGAAVVDGVVEGIDSHTYLRGDDVRQSLLQLQTPMDNALAILANFVTGSQNPLGRAIDQMMLRIASRIATARAAIVAAASGTRPRESTANEELGRFQRADDNYTALVDTGGAGGGGAAAGPTPKTPQELAVDAAQAVKTISEGLQAAMTLFEKVRGWSGQVDWDAFTRLKDAIVKAVSIFVDGINEAGLQAVAMAGQWADDAKKVIDLIGTGVDNFTKLEDFGSLSRTHFESFVADFLYAANYFNDAINTGAKEVTEKAFLFANDAASLIGVISNAVSNMESLKTYGPLVRNNLTTFADDFIYAASYLNTQLSAAVFEISEATLTFSESTGKLVGVISSGVSNLAALKDYSRFSVKALEDFTSDFYYAANALNFRFSEFGDILSETAQTFAEGAGKFVSVISSAVGNFAALKNYSRFSVKALEDFIWDFMYAANAMNYRFKEFGEIISEAQLTFADGAGKLVGVISSAVSNFASLAKYKRLVRESLSDFVDDLLYAATTFQTKLVRSTQVLTDATVAFATAAGGIFQTLSTALDFFAGIQYLGEYVRTPVDTFIADLKAAAEAFVTATADWNEESFTAAGNFADSATKIFGLFKAASDAFQSDFFSISGAAVWIDSIVGVIVGMIQSFVTGIQKAHLTIDAEVTPLLADMGVKLLGGISDLIQAVGKGPVAIRNLGARITEIGTALAGVAVALLIAVKDFEQKTANVALTLAAAIGNIASVFVAMQGNMSRVNSAPLFNFITSIISQFGKLDAALDTLKATGIENNLAFLNSLVGWIKSFLQNFNISFKVPETPKEAEPPKPEEPAKAPPEIIIPPIIIPLLPSEIEDIIKTVMSSIVDMVNGTAGALNVAGDQLDLWLKRADLISKLASAFSTLASAVSTLAQATASWASAAKEGKSAGEPIAAFFSFIDKFMGKIGVWVKTMSGGDAGFLGAIATLLQGIGMLVANVDKIQQLAAIPFNDLAYAAANLGLFIKSTFDIVAKGVAGIPAGAFESMTTGLRAVTDFINAISSGVGSLFGPIPQFSDGAWKTGAGLAELHSGEMVLPRGLAEVVRQSLTAPAPSYTNVGGNSIGTLALNFYGNVDKQQVRQGVREGLSQTGYGASLRSVGLTP